MSDSDADGQVRAEFARLASLTDEQGLAFQQSAAVRLSRIGDRGALP
jgi:hypothetical protein